MATSNYTVPILKVLFPREFPATNVSCRKFPHLKVSNLCPYPGLMVEIINMIAEHLNSTIVAYSYDEVGGEDSGFQIGEVNKGNVTGLMGQVYDGIVDTIAYPFQISRLQIKFDQF